MSFWQPIIVVAIPTLGALGAVWATTRDLRLRRRMETIDRFIQITATAHARSRENVGTSEQVAAIELLAELGASEKELAHAAAAALTDIARWSGTITHGEVIKLSADQAIERLKRSRPDLMPPAAHGDSHQEA